MPSTKNSNASMLLSNDERNDNPAAPDARQPRGVKPPQLDIVGLTRILNLTYFFINFCGAPPQSPPLRAATDCVRVSGRSWCCFCAMARKESGPKPDRRCVGHDGATSPGSPAISSYAG
ncbi:hypothetical protein GEV33_003841 [Tenebrio molitor]|uniref:Uncharacterized protein n=1 Tax=Tenebrio molitor TaxID=7067 RepID=A0A8J6HHP0_TENMO|nr:hypothetical protein GEV33_003841 [Tenebrio molitor]